MEYSSGQGRLLETVNGRDSQLCAPFMSAFQPHSAEQLYKMGVRAQSPNIDNCDPT